MNNLSSKSVDEILEEELDYWLMEVYLQGSQKTYGQLTGSYPPDTNAKAKAKQAIIKTNLKGGNND